MVVSFRVSTLAALLAGLLGGVVVGAIGAQQIAKHWPQSDMFELIKRFPAPSQMTIGVSTDGESALCDTDGFAYALVDYGYERHGKHNEQGVYRTWLGLQELEPLLDKSVEDKDTDGTYIRSTREIQQKCR
jgi:hypothetical protein